MLTEGEEQGEMQLVSEVWGPQQGPLQGIQKSPRNEDEKGEFKINFIMSYWGFPGSSAGKESICNAGDPSSIPGLGRSDGEGIGYPLQCSWTSLVAQLLKNPPVMRETWVGKIPWRRERVSTPVFWPGESHGLYSPWGHKESDTTEQLSLSLFSYENNGKIENNLLIFGE